MAMRAETRRVRGRRHRLGGVAEVANIRGGQKIREGIEQQDEGDRAYENGKGDPAAGEDEADRQAPWGRTLRRSDLGCPRRLDGVAEQRDEENREQRDTQNAECPLRSPVAAKRPSERGGD